jgi:hypothetical protein
MVSDLSDELQTGPPVGIDSVTVVIERALGQVGKSAAFVKDFVSNSKRLEPSTLVSHDVGQIVTRPGELRNQIPPTEIPPYFPNDRADIERMEGGPNPIADDHGDSALSKNTFSTRLMVNIACKACPWVHTLFGTIKNRFAGRSGRHCDSRQANEQGDPSATPHNHLPYQ